MPRDDAITASLAEFVLGAVEPPDAVMHASARVVLDTVGCTIAGLDSAIGRRAAQLKVSQGGEPESTLFGTGMKLPLSSVGYAHAQAGNALDADETLHHRAHFANVVVASSIAAAELTGASGRELLAAVALGFDVAARVGASLPVYVVTDDGEIRTKGAGVGHSYAVFGAAASAGRLLGLDADRVAHAFGLAYMSAPVHTPWVVFPKGVPRQMAKYTMYGAVAQAGLDGVRLAASGFTGNPRVLDREQEFWIGFAAHGCDYDALLRDLGERWYITETSFKRYPFCRQANIALDLLLRIMREQQLTAGDVDEVSVLLAPTSTSDELRARIEDVSEVDAAFTLRYALAVAAAGIPPGPEWVAPSNLESAELHRFGDAISIEVEEAWRADIQDQVLSDGWFKRLPTGVSIRAKGQTFAEHGEYALGDPWIDETVTSDELLGEKFVEFTRRVLGADRAHEAVERAFALERGGTVAEFVSCLHRA